MSTYFFTWGSVLVFALLAKKTDFEFSNELSYGKVDHTSNAKLFFFIGSFILVFVAGCRYYIGSDYYAYYGWYQSYADSFNDRLVSFNEPGISFIYWIIVKFVNDGFACVFIANAVMIFLALRVLRNNTSEIAVALILYSLIFWVATFNGMRQALAVTIIFCGFKFLREKKLFNYCIVVFIAFLFHKSAVVLLLLYFIVHRKINWKNLLILVAITVIFIPMITFFDENGIWGECGAAYEYPQPEQLIKASAHFHAPSMLRKEAYDAVDGYTVDKKLLRVEDYHLWIKMYAAGFKGKNIHTALYQMRDNRNAYQRRTLASRLNESYVKRIAIKELHLPYWMIIYSLRPIVTGLMPGFVYDWLHRNRLSS